MTTEIGLIRKKQPSADTKAELEAQRNRVQDSIRSLIRNRTYLSCITNGKQLTIGELIAVLENEERHLDDVERKFHG